MAGALKGEVAGFATSAAPPVCYSYANYFVLSSAVAKKAKIVTGDPKFRKVKHPAEIIRV